MSFNKIDFPLDDSQSKYISRKKASFYKLNNSNSKDSIKLPEI